MNGINKEDVAYVAGLAKLSLDEQTQERLLKELSAILEYMDKLNELDTSDIEPMSHVLERVNVFREDVVTSSLEREKALSNAPDTDGVYFRVPQILDIG